MLFNVGEREDDEKLFGPDQEFKIVYPVAPLIVGFNVIVCPTHVVTSIPALTVKLDKTSMKTILLGNEQIVLLFTTIEANLL